MNAWCSVVYWSAAVYLVYRVFRWAMRSQPDLVTPLLAPAPAPDRCSDPPCVPEDHWTCAFHAALLIDQLCVAAERYANDQANHA